MCGLVPGCAQIHGLGLCAQHRRRHNWKLSPAGRYSVEITFRETGQLNYYSLEFANDNTTGSPSIQDDGGRPVQWTPSTTTLLAPVSQLTFTLVVKGSEMTVYADDRLLTTLTDTSPGGAWQKFRLGLNLYEADETLTVDFDNLLIKDSQPRTNL